MKKQTLKISQIIEMREALNVLSNNPIDDVSTGLAIAMNLCTIKPLAEIASEEVKKHFNNYSQIVKVKDAQGTEVEVRKITTIKDGEAFSEKEKEIMKGEKEVELDLIDPKKLKGTIVSFHEGVKQEKPIHISSSVFAALKPILKLV